MPKKSTPKKGGKASKSSWVSTPVSEDIAFVRPPYHQQLVLNVSRARGLRMWAATIADSCATAVPRSAHLHGTFSAFGNASRAP